MKLNFAALSALPVILAAAVLPTAVQAADAPVAATTYNLGLVSDYRYRGISQSRLKPALQGGADWSHPSGFYLGTWASTITWIKDGGKIYNNANPGASVDSGDTPFEWDLYGGYKGDIIKDKLSYDVGGLYYLYVGNHYGKIPDQAGANTFELYGALTYGPVTAKYSHSLTNAFGFFESKNSGYLDISASFDVGMGITLAPHVGHQRITGGLNNSASYTDLSLALSKDFNGLTPSLTAVSTNADKAIYPTPSGKFNGKNALVLGLKYSF